MFVVMGKYLFVEFLLIDKLSLGGIHYGIRPIVKVGYVYCDAACCAVLTRSGTKSPVGGILSCILRVGIVVLDEELKDLGISMM